METVWRLPCHSAVIARPMPRSPNPNLHDALTPEAPMRILVQKIIYANALDNNNQEGVRNGPEDTDAVHR